MGFVLRKRIGASLSQAHSSRGGGGSSSSSYTMVVVVTIVLATILLQNGFGRQQTIFIATPVAQSSPAFAELKLEAVTWPFHHRRSLTDRSPLSMVRISPTFPAHTATAYKPHAQCHTSVYTDMPDC